jgi:hypothetical protein
MRITMRFTLGIMKKYIDRNPTASMTNNPPSGCRPSKHCKQQIIALSKVRNVNNANILEHKNAVFSLVATAHLQPWSFLSLPQITRGMNPTIEYNYSLLESLASTRPRYLLAMESMQDHKQHRDNNSAHQLDIVQYSSDPNKHNM